MPIKTTSSQDQGSHHGVSPPQLTPNTQTQKALKPIRNKGESMVLPTGLEPVTYGLEIRCSIQLS